MNEGDLCTYCEEDNVKLCKGSKPHTIDHLICPNCDSTFIIQK